MCRKDGIQMMLIQLEHKIKSNPQLSAACGIKNTSDDIEHLIVSCFETLKLLSENYDPVSD